MEPEEAQRPMNEGPDHISKTEARQGTTPHMTRYILGWGLGLVVIIFLIIVLAWQ
jgi:hypothetical protein